MINLSLFTFSSYEDRIPSMYPFAIAQECKKVTQEIFRSGNVVGDRFLIMNPTITVSNVSNTAIYFVCIELFGHGPVKDKIQTEGTQKTFSLE